jgi:hypothetical protein
MARSGFVGSLLGFCLVALGLSACQTIAGIEERKLDPNASQAHANSKQCKDYCASVMDACHDEFAVYTTLELCMGVCAQLDPGDDNEFAMTNTVACRANQVLAAKAEPDTNCKSAGPGGNGQCGTDCDAYCDLFPKVCPDQNEYPNKAACLQACSGLPEQNSFNVVTDHGGDTIECRLVHVSSATVDPKTHCPHAPIRPSQPWCAGAPKDPPTCEQYCKIVTAACPGDLAQYDSEDQCVAACAALDPGTNADEAGNSVGCRRYHAFNSTLAPTTHCYHAGPSGDGHCGDHGTVEDGHTGNCESYCTLLAAACPSEFQTSMGSADACMAKCVQLPEAEPDSLYTVAKAKQSSGLQCRILHAVQAFEDKTACASATGGDQCK